MDEINLDGVYEQLREELPVPWNTKCTECGRKLITQLDVSYIPEKDHRVKFFRPAYCGECAENNGIYVKLIGEISKDGEFHPKNKEGPLG